MITYEYILAWPVFFLPHASAIYSYKKECNRSFHQNEQSKKWPCTWIRDKGEGLSGSLRFSGRLSISWEVGFAWAAALLFQIFWHGHVMDHSKTIIDYLLLISPKKQKVSEKKVWSRKPAHAIKNNSVRQRFVVRERNKRSQPLSTDSSSPCFLLM